MRAMGREDRIPLPLRKAKGRAAMYAPGPSPTLTTTGYLDLHISRPRSLSHKAGLAEDRFVEDRLEGNGGLLATG
ncbi:protein of unknown function [Candidatus Methylomirabilis oxygeniifera]|uniref:Uncharacterized protein n=1 Tax=Methylomirabilis oxygeniifera TaxID=671143 RepID=D5MEN1_METO1|nr:protein of unknown function [Candidatus Methylomirabilis oxyfera]